MAVAFEKAQELKKELEVEYQARHSAFRSLRGFWHGKYWQDFDRQDTGLSSLFRDLRSRSSDTTPDFKIIHNILQEVCLKYQTYLSPLPMIRVYVDPPESKTRRNQATKKERYLYGLWNQRPLAMSAVLNRVAWYLPLMGDCFLGSFPDIEDKCIRPVLRSPEYAYPVPSYDGTNLDAVIFEWETTTARAAREFPQWDPDARKFFPRRKKNNSNKVKVMEYSDGKEFARWVGETKVAGIEHDYGFNLFDQIPFIFVPDEPWNHGAVEQAVSMNEAENVLRSMLLQAVLENVYPKYVLIDPSKAPEELDMGPGAVWGINAGGDVKTLAPPLQALPVQQGFLADNERAIKQTTGMNESNFGSPRGSIITGKAINEMEAAGAGTVVEMVQGLGIGQAMVSWNEKALCLGHKMFADDQINLAGYETGSSLDIKPAYFSINIKGSELVGGTRNDVVFSPHLDLHSKLVMNLQAMGAGLVSKEHSRNQLGIPDSSAMDEEILGERLQDIVVGAIEQELMQAPQPENAVSAEQRGMAYLAGAVPKGVPAPAPPALPPPVGGGGPPIASLPGGGQVMAPAMEMPPGSALAGPLEAPPEGPPDELLIPLDEAVTAFQSLPVEGRVFLVGEIVDGQTDDDIEVALSDSADRQVIADGLPQYVGRLSFTTVAAEPKEQYVEVTPGAVPEPAGEEPDLDAILAGP